MTAVIGAIAEVGRVAVDDVGDDAVGQLIDIAADRGGSCWNSGHSVSSTNDFGTLTITVVRRWPR